MSNDSMKIIPSKAKRHQLTLEGLADVDAGRVVDHATVAAWATLAEVRAQFADRPPDELQGIIDEAITAARERKL